MIIKDISIQSKCYNSINRVKSYSMNHQDRYSWIIKITDSDECIGYGEASPLPGFNDETFDAAGYALEGFRLAIIENEYIELDEIMILIQIHTIDAPSASFAIETAIFDILSQHQNVGLNKYLNPKALPQIKINGLYKLTSLDNYKVIKIKCGFRNLYDEVQLLSQLSNKYDSSISFILDLNQAYDLPKAIRFFKEMEQFNIEYIEQPIDKDNFADLIELQFHSNIPIALDESINSINSLHHLLEINCGDVFIIKPQSMGSFSKIKKAINLIKEANKIPVITSSLEGIIGRLCSMHLSSANIINACCGLAMEPIYQGEADMIPKITNGLLNISNKSGLGYHQNK